MRKEIQKQTKFLALLIIIIFTLSPYGERVGAQKNQINAGFYWEITMQDENKMHAELWLNPDNQAVNAVGIFADFSTSTLTLDTMEINRDFCQLIIEAKSMDGSVDIQCGLPNPGVDQKTKIADLDFDTIQNGWANLNFHESSMILANDGLGTNILNSIENKKILIQ